MTAFTYNSTVNVELTREPVSRDRDDSRPSSSRLQERERDGSRPASHMSRRHADIATAASSRPTSTDSRERRGETTRERERREREEREEREGEPRGDGGEERALRERQARREERERRAIEAEGQSLLLGVPLEVQEAWVCEDLMFVFQVCYDAQ